MLQRSKALLCPTFASATVHKDIEVHIVLADEDMSTEHLQQKVALITIFGILCPVGRFVESMRVGAKQRRNHYVDSIHSTNSPKTLILFPHFIQS